MNCILFVTALPTGCDFESRDQFGPLCGFYQEDESDDFDWTLNAGETPSLDTGPIADHTFKNNTGKNGVFKVHGSITFLVFP